MEFTFIQILPLALAASVSPTGLLFIMMILSGEAGLKHGARFLFGAALALTVLGLAVMLLWKQGVSEAGAHRSLASGIADITLGLAVVVLLAKAVFMKKEGSSRMSGGGRRPYFALGILYMATNFSTLIPFIAASRIIGSGYLPPWKELVLLAPLVLITMTMVAFPVAVTWLAPRKSQRVLEPLSRFMSRYGARITEGVFLVIAVYLVIHGVATIRFA